MTAPSLVEQQPALQSGISAELVDADTPLIAEVPERRRQIGKVRTSDTLALFGALASATSLTALLFAIAPLSGVLGFVVLDYVVFLGVYAVLVSMDESGSAVRDRLVGVIARSLAGLLLGALFLVVGYVIWRGKAALPHGNFFSKDLVTTGPLEPLTSGGVFHAMIGTLEQIAISLVLTVPLGVAAAVFLSQFRGRLSRTVRTITEAMTALPSIVAGLFIYASFILLLGFRQSGIAASLALSVMMLPIVIRATDVVLRLVPGTLVEASYALGSSQWRTVWHVILPTARSGIATAVILGTARGIGETSPVLITAGYTTRLNANPFSEAQTSLPLLVFRLSRDPQATMVSRAFGAAALLMTIVLVLFIAARLIGGRGPGQLTRRQQRRRAADSLADERRITHLVAVARHGHPVGECGLDLLPASANDQRNPL